MKQGNRLPDWIRSSILALLCLVVTVPGWAQDTMPSASNAASGSLADAVRQLQEQVSELHAAVTDLRAEAAQYRAETADLRRELQDTRRQLAATATPPTSNSSRLAGSRRGFGECRRGRSQAVAILGAANCFAGGLIPALEQQA